MKKQTKLIKDKYPLGFWICVGLLSLLVIIVGFRYNQEPEYTTYKEQCTLQEQVAYRNNETPQMIIIPVDTRYDFIGFENRTYYRSSTLNEFCEQVEVQPKSLNEAWKICWKENISEDDFVHCSLLEEGLKFDTEETANLWLGEFCKCSYYSSKCKTSTIPNERCPCETWNCGDYVVRKQ